LPGDYDIKISRDGFQSWNKKTDVHSGLSSEFWNVILVRNSYERLDENAVGVNKFFTSPGNSYIALADKTEKDLEVKIFDVNPQEEKLIFSEKATDTEKLKEILKNYKMDDVVEGEITGVVDFGAFMKFGDLEGLIHISELDWQLIENPSEIVKVGEKVKVKIIEITGDGRVSLSLKALKKDPWVGIEEKYKKGDEIKGEVTKFNIFGAFVEIGPKIQGLCHISEFGTKAKMEESLQVGKNYKFQILQIDPAEHRMTLKLI